MDSKHELAPPQRARSWTRSEDYIEALARRRTARRHRGPRPRTQPEAPRLLLSTAPFMMLIGALGILAFAIMVAAYPGRAAEAERQTAPHVQGVASKGWFQDAEKDFK